MQIHNNVDITTQLMVIGCLAPEKQHQIKL
jgi:hypothetical protein